MVPPVGMHGINVCIGHTDTLHVATCINSIKIPPFEEEDYRTFKVTMDSMIDTDSFTSITVSIIKMYVSLVLLKCVARSCYFVLKLTCTASLSRG